MDGGLVAVQHNEQAMRELVDVISVDAKACLPRSGSVCCMAARQLDLVSSMHAWRMAAHRNLDSVQQSTVMWSRPGVQSVHHVH